MFITIILYYREKQRVSLMNKIYTDRMISSKQCRRRTMKNHPNKPEVDTNSLPSLVTSHGIQDSFCPWKINSVTRGTFIQVLVSLSRLIVVSIEFDWSVIADGWARSPFNVSLNPLFPSRTIVVSIGLDHRSALRSKLHHPSMFNSLFCFSLDRSMPSLKHRWATKSKSDHAAIFHSISFLISRSIIDSFGSSFIAEK
jgi:hypothetical protein